MSNQFHKFCGYCSKQPCECPPLTTSGGTNSNGPRLFWNPGDDSTPGSYYIEMSAYESLQAKAEKLVDALTEIQDHCPVERYRNVAREALKEWEKS